MKKIIISLFLPLLLMAVTTSFVPAASGATNPFLSPQKKQDSPTTENSAIFTTNSPKESLLTSSSINQKVNSKANLRISHSSSFFSSVLTKITILQKDLRSKMTGFARDVKKDSFGTSFWLFLLFSFAYGVVHAIGPGHGKSVVCAYFISRRGTIRTAAFMSWAITLVHVGSATVTVCVAYLLLSSGMSGFENFNRHLQTASFGLVMLIGLWLFLSTLISAFKKKNEEYSAPAKCASLKEITSVAFVTGLVPCPGAAIILVYTLSTGILWAGLIAMLFLATGMALTTSLFAFAAAKTRTAMDHASRGRKTQIIYTTLSLAGSLIIILFGTLMLSSHLG
ncbi:nickel/cobalt transporter [Maridesulfovibrio frigidus]|uniref:nickel/cobalt transporter n=1 Tax=Maridesulfovibrio frigidus TaxID=340956 RepID=UPI0004E19806|nr:nickel ABC transporter permease [Maridesulfovibrio frigidus]